MLASHEQQTTVYFFVICTKSQQCGRTQWKRKTGQTDIYPLTLVSVGFYVMQLEDFEHHAVCFPDTVLLHVLIVSFVFTNNL